VSAPLSALVACKLGQRRRRDNPDRKDYRDPIERICQPRWAVSAGR